MTNTGAYKVAVAVAVILTVAAIAYGYEGLRADEAPPQTGEPPMMVVVATSTPVALPTVVVATVAVPVAKTTEPEGGITIQDLFGTTTSPIILAAKGVDVEAILAANTKRLILTGSVIRFQVRGGDNPCRYLYTSNRVGTFAGGELALIFVAGTHDEVGLAATGEMHLYGDTGPHLFEIEDADSSVILTVAVARGATVHAKVAFPTPGLYRLYDRLYGQSVHVSEITARPVGQPGSVAVTDWCPSEESAP